MLSRKGLQEASRDAPGYIQRGDANGAAIHADDGPDFEAASHQPQSEGPSNCGSETLAAQDQGLAMLQKANGRCKQSTRAPRPQRLFHGSHSAHCRLAKSHETSWSIIIAWNPVYALVQLLQEGPDWRQTERWPLVISFSRKGL
ncbi:unnamed protein product [Symbiodinium natans]|uniref:Uncharacterized protein n=1 Tax=Symbiodinium natans TaxID=878477 RepID=A0A812S182_9DINO|nr:unnamed protein product [Symbiodinium natans]